MRKKANEQHNSPDRLNVIVEGSRVIGDMITESNLRIDGEVKGNVTSASKVVIGKNGFIHGNLTCFDADIEGNVIGLIKTDGMTTLRASAKIEGEITTVKLHIEEGAEFTGNCKMNSVKSQSTLKSVEKIQEDIVY